MTNSEKLEHIRGLLWSIQRLLESKDFDVAMQSACNVMVLRVNELVAQL